VTLTLFEQHGVCIHWDSLDHPTHNRILRVMLDEANDASGSQNPLHFLNERESVNWFNVVKNANRCGEIEFAILEWEPVGRLLVANLQPAGGLHHFGGRVAPDGTRELSLTESQQITFTAPDIQPAHCSR
jgi:hypothetical protein